MNLSWIKKVYLYLVSLISLVILVIAGIMLINIALKAWVFKKADLATYYPPQVMCNPPKNPDGSSGAIPAECSDPNYQAEQKQQEIDRLAAQRQSDAAHAVAMIIIAAPVFYYHWKLARKES